MDNSIDYDFDKRCLNIIKDEVLRLSYGVEGKIFLYGSRANGSFKRGSDIDIGVEGMDDSKFRKLRLKLDMFWEECIVPYHIDFVNFDKVRDDFRAIAIKEIVIWKEN